MTDTSATTAADENGAGAGEQKQDQTFTQADVDRIVKAKAERLAKQLYPDYDELRTKAEGAKTLEDRVASLEGELNTSKADALRTRIAAEYGISTKKGDKGEPSDADLFLTGSDEATLTAQASRLAAQVAERKKTGNVAPKEGAPKTEGKGDEDMRAFARNLFAGAD